MKVCGCTVLVSIDVRIHRVVFLTKHSIAGSGKSVLCAAVIERYFNKYPQANIVGTNDAIISFYFQSALSSTEMIRSLIAQLARSISYLPEQLLSLYDSFSDAQNGPTYIKLLEVLISTLEAKSKVMIFIDALDECLNAKGELLDALDYLISRKPARHILLLHKPSLAIHQEWSFEITYNIC